MEKDAFTPLDRIGSSPCTNIDIIDTREKLGIYAKAGLLSLGGVRVWCNKSVVNNLTCR
jgi:argininosuccinate synthase